MSMKKTFLCVIDVLSPEDFTEEDALKHILNMEVGINSTPSKFRVHLEIKSYSEMFKENKIPEDNVFIKGDMVIVLESEDIRECFWNKVGKVKSCFPENVYLVELQDGKEYVFQGCYLQDFI